MNWRDTWGGEDLQSPQRAAAIDACFHDAYLAAAPGSLEQKRIISAFVSRFPLLAFRPHSWFYNLWLEWRLNFTKDQKLLLNAVGRGVSTPILAFHAGGGFRYQCTKRTLYDQRVSQARQALATLRADRRLKAAFECYRKSKRDTVRGRTDRFLDLVMARFIEVAGLSTKKIEPVPSDQRTADGPTWKLVPHSAHFPLLHAVRRQVQVKNLASARLLFVRRLYQVEDDDLH